jgi:hypothetical protein
VRAGRRPPRPGLAGDQAQLAHQLNLVHVIHGENGKATEVWASSSDPAGAVAFWS